MEIKRIANSDSRPTPTLPDMIKNIVEKVNYLQDETIIISLSNEMINNKEKFENIIADIALLHKAGSFPIIIHEGTDMVEEVIKTFNVPQSYLDENIRITNKPVINVTDMVLTGIINKQIVSELGKHNLNAVGISGKDSNLISARKIRCTKISPDSNVETIVNLGFIGEPSSINPELILSLEEAEIIPVIAPIAMGEDGHTYKLNGDETACALASSIAANRLIIFCEDNLEQFKNLIIRNLEQMVTPDKTPGKTKGNKITEISAELSEKLAIASEAAERHVEYIHIIPESAKHALLTDLFSDERQGALIHN